MSQTLQNQILLAKSMNGIVTLSDGQGTTISNGQVTSNSISSGSITTGSISTTSVDLQTSLQLEKYDTITTPIGSVSLYEKGNSYFTYLPQSLATPSHSSDLITKQYADATYSFSSSSILTSDNTFTGSNSFSKLSFSNISSSVTITNQDFGSPVYSVGLNNLLYLGTGNYTGLSGWIFSTTSSNSYAVYIISGSNISPFYVPSFPTTSNQVLGITADLIRAQTSNYSLAKGEYTISFQLYATTNGNNLTSKMSLYVYDNTGTLFGKVTDLNPSLNLDWASYTIDFYIPSTSQIYFQFIYSNTVTTSIALANLQLRQNNCLSITDTTTNTVSTLGGSESILNSLFVRNGLQVDNGGLNVIGGISTKTSYGINNVSLNTNFSSTSSTNNNDNVVIGNSALLLSQSANRNVVLGSGTGKYINSVNDSVILGYNLNAFASISNSIFLGSSMVLARPVSTDSSVIIGGNCCKSGSCGSFTTAVGANIFNQYCGYQNVIPDYSTAIGYSSQANGGDYYNTSVGALSLSNMGGSSDIYGAVGLSGYHTQYNTAVGYNSGSTYAKYTNCLFLGAGADTNANDLTNATAIGYNCKVDTSNKLQLGSNGETVGISGSLTNGTTVLTSTKFNAVTNCFTRSAINSYTNISSNYTINVGDPEVNVINSSSVTNIYLPNPSGNSGMKFIVIKGYAVKGLQITINNSGSGYFYNTQFSQTYTATATITATANYVTCVAVGNGTTGQVDWIIYCGQDFQSGIFSLSGNYYVSSQLSQKIIYQNFTVPTPYNEYYSIGTNNNIQITLPRITPTSFNTLTNTLTTSSTTGQELTFRRTIGSTTSMITSLFAYSSPNQFYSQAIYSTSNTTLNSWTGSLSLSLVPLSYHKTLQNCQITVNYATPTTSTIVAPFTIDGITSGTTLTPISIVAITGSTSGTTLTLTVTSVALAVGQYVSAIGMTLGTYIVSGSGLTWTLSNSVTLASRTFTFYPKYMTSGNTLNSSTVVLNSGTGYSIQNNFFNSSQLIYPTAVNYATNNIPSFTLNQSVANLNSTFTFYPISLACSSAFDPFPSVDTCIPQLINSTTIDSVSFKCTYTTNGTPSIQNLYDNTISTGSFLNTGIALPVFGWFQL